MPTSIFTDQSRPPTAADLKEVLGKTYNLWNQLHDFVFQCNPDATDEWKYGGKNYGWGYRIKDAKRVIVYFMPCNKYLIASLVFGEAATKLALESKVSTEIKTIISSAKVYAEGRGIRIEVKNKATLEDVKILVGIKVGK